ncbi:hypothetical protein [Nesterenkonia sp. Act20]|uniref:hypothetical protein n=1 Tax=Nesterenkonia sp. Act20 TaxID=1483432 RepID=UPI001C45951E|nr:hypothetical protein [Nesterenkonia sp. Act20]
MSWLRGYGTGISFAARLPGPLLPIGVMAATAAGTGSMFTTATLVAAALVGMSVGGPAASLLASRVGARNVLLVSAIVHVLMLVLMVSSIDRLTRQDTLTSDAVIYVLLLVFAAVAGLSAPATATFSRAQRWVPATPPMQADHGVRAGLRHEVRLDDAALIAAPLLVAALSFGVGPTAGLLTSAVLTASAVPLFAVDRALPDMTPVEPARFPLGGVEHAQQLLLEHRGLAPEELPHRAYLPAELEEEILAEDPRPGEGSDAAETGGARGLVAATLLAAALGGVLGALWMTVLGSAQTLPRPSLFTVPMALVAAASVLAGRANSQAFGSPLLLRRRRLHAAVLLVLTLVLLAVATLGPTAGSFLVLSGLCVLSAVMLGRLSIALYASLGMGASVGRLPNAMSAVSGGLLLGLALGLTLAGIAADELGYGWSTLVAASGSLVAVVVVLGGQLWGTPQSGGPKTSSLRESGEGSA